VSIPRPDGSGSDVRDVPCSQLETLLNPPPPPPDEDEGVG
jgi:hypothetical protein